MKEEMKFDYYYGVETEQFTFYRVPRLLIKEERFKGLSSDAKLLYGLMLDRLSLSRKNGWLDQEERAYIYYTIDTIMEDLGCAKATCTKILAELDSKKGIGLIERIRQGLGKPDRIYVKNFATLDPKDPVETIEEKKVWEEKNETEDSESERKQGKDFAKKEKKEDQPEKLEKSESQKEEMEGNDSLSQRTLEAGALTSQGASVLQESFLLKGLLPSESLEATMEEEREETASRKKSLEWEQKEEEWKGGIKNDSIEQRRGTEVLEKREDPQGQAGGFQEVQKLNFKREENPLLDNSNLSLTEGQILDFQSSKKQTSRGTKIELLEVQNLGGSYNKKRENIVSQNDKIHPIPSISSIQEIQKTEREIMEEETKDRNDPMEEAFAYRELIQEQIDYQHYMGLEDWKDRALYEELYEVICEVVCVKHKTIRIGGESYPYEWVKAKFLKLNSRHLQYVMDRMQQISSKILNIKAYLLTALYNAPNTMHHFYQQEVNYDMLGGGWKEKGIV